MLHINKGNSYRLRKPISYSTVFFFFTPYSGVGQVHYNTTTLLIGFLFNFRYKVQKHIIALQKAKLEEQNRLIEELKYNKIIEASRQSVDNMREEVRRTYYEIDRQLKPRIKTLTKELKITDIEGK